MIDIDVFVEESKVNEGFQLIKFIKVLNRDITEPMSRLCQTGTNSLNLKRKLKEFLVVPEELININVNENIKIKKMIFENYYEEFELDF